MRTNYDVNRVQVLFCLCPILENFKVYSFRFPTLFFLVVSIKHCPSEKLDMCKRNLTIYIKMSCECGEDRIKGHEYIQFISLCYSQFKNPRTTTIYTINFKILKSLKVIESSSYILFQIYVSNIVSPLRHWFIYSIEVTPIIAFSQTCYSYSYLYFVGFTTVLLEIIHLFIHFFI